MNTQQTQSIRPLVRPRLFKRSNPEWVRGWLWRVSRQRSILVVLLLGIRGGQAQPPATAMAPIPPETIQTWLTDHHVPTVGIGYIENGALTRMNVYTSNPASPAGSAGTVFNVASLTKPVVAMLTLMLVSQGQWALDAPLAPYWVDPDVRDDPRHHQLTTRHVLAQQTGFVNWRWNHPTRRLTFDTAPGTSFGYSGEGFEYLKRAMESKFGQPLEQLADSILFKPLGMKDTRFYWKGTVDEARFAREYDRQGQPYPTQQRTQASAADDLLTTVADYGRLCQAVLTGSGLSEAVFQDMIRAQTTVNSANHVFWGLGWELITPFKNGEYALYHGGSDQGVRAMVVLFPRSKRGLLILTNADGGQAVIKQIVRTALPEGQELIERLN